MGKLGEELGKASEKRREAERLRAEARQEEWLISRTAQWIMGAADGGPFSHQPRPKLESVPRTFSGEGLVLERPWWNR